MCLLYEFGDWAITKDRDSLRALAQSIWRDRKLSYGVIEEKPEEVDVSFQPFLSFDGNKIRARNYMGFIQNGDEVIEIYPKVFKRLPGIGKQLMLRHVFYWLSYCRKWRFPFNKVNLDNREVESFPELIIYLMASQIFETLSDHVLHQYQPVEEAMTTPRGRINFHRYVSNSLSRGNHHYLECDHEPFLYDNGVNKIIKYCSRLLLAQTRVAESQRLLQETLFILDEVEDVPCSIHDINRTTFNSFFDDYQLLIEICKSILGQHLYWNSSYNISQWCLLFPMEYVFEDFIAGFLQAHFLDRWKVEYQKSNVYLASKPEAFQMRHDIFLTSRDGSKREVIIDAKYKLREYSSDDKKKGVVQSDLYQAVSYAYRRGCNEIVLLYPNYSEACRVEDVFEIPSGFPGGPMIKVIVLEIPFWSVTAFELLTANLRNQLNRVLG